MKEAAKDADLRNQVADIVPFLRPGERVLGVQCVPTPKPDALMDYRKALCLLTGVNDPKDIGLNGPPSAAKALQGHERSPGQGLFDCDFARDALNAAEDLLPEFPQVAYAALHKFAGLLGMIEDYRSWNDEELGRMFHESRDPDDPIARKLTQEQGWGWPFYGAVDTTPLFVRVMAKYFLALRPEERGGFLDQEYSGRDGNVYTMFDALTFAMRWIVRRLSGNPEGYLEYRHSFEGDHLNQVMEDSWDSHFHEDGSLANCNQGIASAEVQGLAYDSLVYAEMLYHYKYPDAFLQAEAAYFIALAQRLKRRIMSQLWVSEEDGGYFAVGTDRDERGRARVMKVKKAIPAFLFDTGLFSDGSFADKVAAQIRTIFSKPMLAAGGVRSLAIGQPRFMPGGYHTGNVWLLQTFKIAEGLRRLNFPNLAAELDRRVVKVVEDSRMYPEFARGGTESDIRLNERIVDTWDKIDQRNNRREQPPQQIQLWTVSAYAAIKYRQENDPKPPPPSKSEDLVLNSL